MPLYVLETLLLIFAQQQVNGCEPTMLWLARVEG